MCASQGPCTDLEDLATEPLYEAAGLLLDRRSRWRRRGLFVTDFCASEWCQQQAAFELTAKVPKVSHTRRSLPGALVLLTFLSM